MTADYLLSLWHFVKFCAHFCLENWKILRFSRVMGPAGKQHNYRLRQFGAAINVLLSAEWKIICLCKLLPSTGVQADRFNIYLTTRITEPNSWVSKSTELTPWSRNVLRKLKIPQVFEEFHETFWTRSFITLFRLAAPPHCELYGKIVVSVVEKYLSPRPKRTLEDQHLIFMYEVHTFLQELHQWSSYGSLIIWQRKYSWE